jgi:hypothetical protein
MVLRWRLVVTVMAFALVACGGGGGTDGDAVGPPPVPAGGKVADAATARTVVLQQADMPAGWRGAAHSEDPTEVTRARELSLCLGRPDPQTFRSAIVSGPDLTLGQTQVSSTATVLNTVEDAKADLEAIRGPNYGTCLATAFRDALRPQAGAARIENLGSEPLAVESFGDGSVAIRLTADLVYSDHTDHVFADLVYITKNRATVSTTFFSIGQPFPAPLEQSLVSRLGNRIAAA